MNNFKQFILTFLFLIVTTNLYSQINTSTGGAINVQPNNPTTNTNVGIGTNQPVERLDVRGNIQGQMGIFTNSLPNGTIFTDWNQAMDRSLVFSAGALLGSGPGYLRTRMFHFYDFPQSNFTAKPLLFFSIEDRDDIKRYRFSAQTGGNSNMTIYNKNQQSILDFFDNDSNSYTLTLPQENSFVGIGTNNFIDGTDTYRLSVNGNIRAHRVKVYTSWADYVFYNNYNLKSLEEVEDFIKANGHLENIPSAKEVEENGIELGEMNKKLLEKIEELTLYVIQLNKEIKELKSK